MYLITEEYHCSISCYSKEDHIPCLDQVAEKEQDVDKVSDKEQDREQDEVVDKVMEKEQDQELYETTRNKRQKSKKCIDGEGQ